MEACDPEVFKMIGVHCDQYVWRCGALSELLLRTPFLWLGTGAMGGGFSRGHICKEAARGLQTVRLSVFNLSYCLSRRSCL